MSIGELSALKSLIGLAEPGGFTLPAELVAAFDVYTQTRALQITPPERLDVDTAAAQVVHAITTGEQPDLAELGHAVNHARIDAAAYEQSVLILGHAQEQAGNTAVLLASDLTERIITDHLRPALEDVHDQAKKAAADLAGHTLDPAALLRAPAKVRTAYLSLAPLIARRTAIYESRSRINRIGNREPKYDHGRLYGLFRRPMTFFPQWKPPARIPALPLPEDQTEQLLFMVSDAATAAQPWLPTVAEQDAAWLEKFGEVQQARANAASFSRGLIPTG